MREPDREFFDRPAYQIFGTRLSELSVKRAEPIRIHPDGFFPWQYDDIVYHTHP